VKRSDTYLIVGIILSALLHGAFIETVVLINESDMARKLFKKSTFVPFEVKKPEPPPPKPPDPPKPKPKPKPTPPPPNTEKPAPPPQEEVQPVFGVTKDTVAKADTGIGVRVGNTLMKEMEKEYTPPEQVRDLAKVEDKRPEPPKFAPIPVFKLAKMPEVKAKIKPEYPAQLRKDEIEGEVLLKVSINKLGQIVDAKVVASDHELFSKAALAAIRQWQFKPALLANGEAVDSVVDIPVIFQLEF